MHSHSIHPYPQKPFGYFLVFRRDQSGVLRILSFAGETTSFLRAIKFLPGEMIIEAFRRFEGDGPMFLEDFEAEFSDGLIYLIERQGEPKGDEPSLLFAECLAKAEDSALRKSLLKIFQYLSGAYQEKVRVIEDEDLI